MRRRDQPQLQYPYMEAADAAASASDHGRKLHELPWLYLDSVGQEYGPVPGWTMKEWLNLGRFPVGGELRVRLPEWERHMPLRKLFPDLHTAFSLPPAWPDVYEDGVLIGESGSPIAEALNAAATASAMRRAQQHQQEQQQQMQQQMQQFQQQQAMCYNGHHQQAHHAHQMQSHQLQHQHQHNSQHMQHAQSQPAPHMRHPHAQQHQQQHQQQQQPQQQHHQHQQQSRQNFQPQQQQQQQRQRMRQSWSPPPDATTWSSAPKSQGQLESYAPQWGEVDTSQQLKYNPAPPGNFLHPLLREFCSDCGAPVGIGSLGCPGCDPEWKQHQQQEEQRLLQQQQEQEREQRQ